MRSLTTLVLLLVGAAANAQLSLLPQIGLENSRTDITVNNTVFRPMNHELSPRASLRLDYKFKKGHGPFIGVATAPAVVQFNFADPSTALSNFKAAAGSTQLRFEGGYGYSFKPIQLGKSSKSNLAKTPAQKTKTPAKKTVTKTEVRKSCGSYSYRSQCGSKSVTKTITQKVTAPKQSWNLRIQPSVGATYIPSVKEDFSVKQAGNYQYNAGNWNTALISGVGLEFGKGNDRKFTLGVYHLKGLGNLDTKTLTTVSGAKTTETEFSSARSSWSAAIGIPFTLSKKKAVQKSPVIYRYKTEQKQESKKSNCEEIKKKCGGVRA